MSSEQKRHTGAGLLLCAVLVAMPLMVQAEERAGLSTNDGFSYNIRTLVFAEAQAPAHSTQNPDNAFLQLYRYSTEIDVRPDFFYDAEYVSGVFKPRLTSAYRWWEDGITKGETDTLTRAFVNEWRVQVKPQPSLFLSFGKEKLLWGPSFLASPSNILFKDTEKINPMTEVEGKYLARVMYLPNSSLTVNAIAETQKDDTMAQVNDSPVRAVKADWVGASASLSVIGYFKRDDRFRLGSYGQVTASEALVLYYDGIVSRGTDVLYPVRDPAGPLGGAFVKQYDGSERLFATVTAGGAYTFLGGSTLSMEFLYNGAGYDDAEARDYYLLRRNAADHFFDGGAMSGLSQQTLGESLNTGSPFLRRYYLMGQYQVREIKNVLDVMVRYVHSLEERAGLASSIIEWQLSDRVQFFNINSVNVGRDHETEFNAVLAWSVMAGMEIHF